MAIEFSPENAIKLVADDIESLRPVDVYRVLSTYSDHIEEMRGYIIKNHPSNQRMLDKVREAYEEIMEDKELIPCRIL